MLSEQNMEDRPRDQYEQYDRLPVLLRRFSFSEKMRIATIYSSQGILFKRNLRENKNMVLPWCVETFVLLAMEAVEYAGEDFVGTHEKKAVKMFNAIWDATSSVLNRPYGRFSFADVFLPVTLLTQTPLQEIHWIYKYRYWSVFNNNAEPVFLRQTFIEKMGAEYEEYLLFGEVLEVLFLAQSEHRHVSIPQAVLRYLLEKRFPYVMKNMLVTREKYVELQQRYIENDADPYKYVYSLRPSFQYPLVENGDSIYFPLPHLMIQSVTSSLMYRITENNNELRTSIGKHVWEQYLYDVVYESGAYEGVYREQLYKNRKSELYGPDVLARKGNEVLFLDSKSTVPSTGIRALKVDSFESNIKIVGENIAKLARHIWEFKDFSPFGNEVSYDAKDHWGVVVVLEDAYIRRQYYYESAREILRLEEGSEKWLWVVSHIKVASLYDVEKLSLSGHNIIDACKECFADDPYSYGFAGFRDGGFVPRNQSYLSFARTHQEKLDLLIRELLQWMN